MVIFAPIQSIAQSYTFLVSQPICLTYIKDGLYIE